VCPVRLQSVVATHRGATPGASLDHIDGRSIRHLDSTHPLIFYFALTYAISWPLWLLSRLAGGTLGTVLLVIGGFGPMIAAAVTLRRSGGSLSDWARGLLRWRVPIAYYAYALALPALIMVLMNLGLTALGVQPDWSEVPGRLPAYLQTFLLTALIFGVRRSPAGEDSPSPGSSSGTPHWWPR
jgi:hypothetical protein